VRRVAVNFSDLLPRLPKTKPWSLEEHFPDDVEIALYWSAKDWSSTEEAAFEDAYCDFAERHDGRLALVVAFGQAPEWAVPLWDGQARAEELMRVSEDNLVAVTGTHLDDRKARAFMATVRSMKGSLMGVGVSDPDRLRGLVAATSSSWISATRYGETVVWDGARLRRFPASRKAEVRQRYKTAILKSGVDYEAVKDDDKEAVIALTLWSWQQMENHMVTRRIRPIPPEDDEGEVVDLATRSGFRPSEPNVDHTDEGVDRSAGGGGTLAVIEQREQTPLPVLQATTTRVGEGEDATDVTTLSLSQRTLRQCDSCAIADRCPAFKPNHVCAYNIPIEVRTKDQLTGLLTGVIEMQGQRIMFARMAEELDGGYPDPNLSNELDRLMSMTEKFKDISDNRDFINIQVEAKGQGGILSRLFGDHVGEQARALPSGGTSPEGTDAFLKDALDIVDAEEVPPDPVDGS
jgi:hypothetical protein